MKKTITVILSFIMCFLACASVNAENAFITLNAVKSEDLITLTISADKAFSVASIEVKYDETKLIFDSSVFSDDLASASVMINPDYSENSLKFSVVASECILPESVCTINFKQMKYASGIARFSVKNVAMGDLEEYSVSSEEIEIVIDDNTSGKSRNVGGNVSKSIDEQVIPKQDLSESKTTSKYFVNQFDDIKQTDWFYDAVKFAFENGIASGISKTEFLPLGIVTRGQFITMLCRAYKVPEMTGDNFSDCENTWYTGYLAAAKQLGISNGIGDNMFAPEKEITREEMVTLIYNYLKSIGEAEGEFDDTQFADDYLISNWAKTGVTFASEKGYVNGKGNNTFDPKGKATRAELAQIFYNVLNK